MRLLAVARRVRRRLASAQRTPGLPEGLSPALLDAVCRRQRGAPVASASFVHLSGWKSSGAFRVMMRTSTGGRWSVVFKRASYDPLHIPALCGLPVLPGRGEHWVYTRASQSLRGHLPSVYHVEEVQPELVYDYLLEDLALRAHRPSSHEVIAVAADLPRLHRALARTPDVPPVPLPRYDTAYGAALRAYATNNVERYLGRHQDPALADLWKSLPVIASAHTECAPPPSVPRTLIHGDCNTSNVHRTRAQECVYVDWEWAGTGVPHADLASLLCRADDEVARRALAAFVAGYPHIPPEDHERAYEWCHIERGLLDVGFLTAQLLDAPGGAQFDLAAYARASLARARTAARRLT